MELNSFANERGLATGNGADEGGLTTTAESQSENPNATSTQDMIIANASNHNEFPSVARRTAIVAGVALALFCVRRRRLSMRRRMAQI